MNFLPVDTIAAFLIGALIGFAVGALYCSRRRERALSDSEPTYTHRAP